MTLNVFKIGLSIILIVTFLEQVEWLLLGPSTTFRLQKSPAKANYNMSSLKLMLIGGASLKEENQKALTEMFPNTRICQGYGMNRHKVDLLFPFGILLNQLVSIGVLAWHIDGAFFN